MFVTIFLLFYSTIIYSFIHLSNIHKEPNETFQKVKLTPQAQLEASTVNKF